jgi:aldose 1-epimerase
MDMIELATGGATLRIVPELGGSIASFEVAGTPILRPMPAAALAAGDVTGSACYPLVPYSNRIRDAKLRFGGRTFALAHNFGAHPHAIHGVGWQRPWTIEAASDTRLCIALNHDASGPDARAWPWPFRATQAFHLADAARGDAAPRTVLVMTLTLRNVGAAPFPFGLG